MCSLRLWWNYHIKSVLGGAIEDYKMKYALCDRGWICVQQIRYVTHSPVISAAIISMAPRWTTESMAEHGVCVITKKNQHCSIRLRPSMALEVSLEILNEGMFIKRPGFVYIWQGRSGQRLGNIPLRASIATRWLLQKLFETRNVVFAQNCAQHGNLGTCIALILQVLEIKNVDIAHNLGQHGSLAMHHCFWIWSKDSVGATRAQLWPAHVLTHTPYWLILFSMQVSPSSDYWCLLTWFAVNGDSVFCSGSVGIQKPLIYYGVFRFILKRVWSGEQTQTWT